MNAGGFLKEMIERNYKEVMTNIRNTSAYIGESEAKHMVDKLHDAHAGIIDLYVTSLSALDRNDLDNYNYMMAELTKGDIRDKYRSSSYVGRGVS